MRLEAVLGPERKGCVDLEQRAVRGDDAADVRKLFKKCGIAYRSIDIDSVEYQKDDRGGKVRAAVAARTGSVTIPQIFVGGQFIGGAAEVFDAFKKGDLQKLLSASGVTFEAGLEFDPYALLPNWLSSGKAS